MFCVLDMTPVSSTPHIKASGILPLAFMVFGQSLKQIFFVLILATSLHRLASPPRTVRIGFAIWVCNVLLFSCGELTPRTAPPVETLFTRLPATFTGIDFRNDLAYTEEFNPYTFRNFFNGGGVGLADVNNDGLLDIYLCGNQGPNKLYLNRGNWLFEDVTDYAGVACRGVWSSGASWVDLNGDGWLDLYVCKSGSPEGKNRHNELFINNADPDAKGRVTFTEQAAKWGLDDLGLSTHAAFFDYDRDGDLDCYLLNNSLRSVGGYDLIEGQRNIPDSLGGNRLYRNDGGHFTDVSQEAGIYSSAIGFGLGVTIGDINRDGWQDIYVSNDFFERDYLYLNNGDGTFREVLTEQMPEISLSSMGADMADLNHDGFPEVFVTDMLPEHDARMKTKTMFENWDKYSLNLRQGYHRQFTRNSLQLNHANGTFSEIGRMAGVHATDWSWGALIFDFDNDGYRDIFVANGIYKDLTDQDYINFFASPATVRTILQRDHAVIAQLIDSIPSEAVPNYAFVRERESGNDFVPRFRNEAAALGLGEPSFSNGSAYGDLDNDGDLDLVINNVNMEAWVYRNNTDSLHPQHHWLGIDLRGEGVNRFALGAQVTVYAGGKVHFQELAPMRGFESCVDPRLLFGLGESQADSLHVRWPDGRVTLLREVESDRYLTLEAHNATGGPSHLPFPTDSDALWFQEVPAPDFTHIENDFQDFRRDRLLFHMRSTEGPALCAADLNGDGLEDVYVGGAKDQPGVWMMQQRDGSFVPQNHEVLKADAASEDVACICFDANGDGRPDLLVASGGNEFPASSTALRDRLYLNDGRGGLRKDEQALREVGLRNTGAVAVADFDGDGDIDLFVGTRLEPFLFGKPVDGLLLRNNGRGQFTDVTDELAPELRELGHITSAVWVDIDRDGDLDLVVAGEWMPVCVFLNEKGRLRRVEAGLGASHGWWRSVAATDLNGDGFPDLVLGNLGLNTRFKASPDRPATLHVGDFDRNGSPDHLITVYEGDRAFPVALRPDLVAQLPAMKRKYLKHINYREQTIEDLLSPAQLKASLRHEVYWGASAVAINDGKGSFELRPLPAEAQISPVWAILPWDLDGDGRPELILGGNLMQAKPETGIYAGSYGVLLTPDDDGNLKSLPAIQSGLVLRGAVRGLLRVRTREGDQLVVARNDATLQLFRFQQKVLLP